MRHRQRLVRLETYQRQCHGRPHHLSIVKDPWELPDEDRARWLQEDLPCACGQVGCPDMTIGALLPGKTPSIEAWAKRAQEYYAQRRVHDA
jgi:hypothetical protein